MGLQWKALDVQAPVCQLDGYHSVFLVESSPSPLICVLKHNSTVILRLNPVDCESVVFVGSIEENELVLNILDISGTVYKLATSGHLYRLVCTASIAGGSGNGVFGLSGSGSNESETYSWTKVGSTLGKIISITGLSDGFAAICDCEGAIYLKIFEVREKPLVRNSIRLPKTGTSEASWFITSLKKENLNVVFTKYLVSELALVVMDLVVIASPNGLISTYPVIPKSQFVEPMPIHFDSGSLVHLGTTPCKRALVFVYETGKVVFAIFYPELKQLKYKKHYFSTSVKTALVYQSGSKFGIVWSNGMSTYFTGLSDFSEFSFNEFELPVMGILTLFKMNQEVLALNINCCFYKLMLSTEDQMANNALNFEGVLENISEVGAEIDKIKAEIRNTNDQYSALMNEQIDGSQIALKVEGNDLFVENLSTKDFLKEIWQIKVESCVSGVNFVKHFLLENHLKPNTSVTVPIAFFMASGCEKLNVSLVGNVNGPEKSRLLLLETGSVNISNSSLTDLKAEFCAKMLSIFS